MTTTQMLALAIGGLAVLLSAQLLRSMVAQRGRQGESDPSFRQVGTFGKIGASGTRVETLPSTGSSGRALLILFVLAAACATGITAKVAWDETHPDIRSAYGRAYERCVQEGVSRWKVDEVNRCISKSRASSRS